MTMRNNRIQLCRRDQDVDLTRRRSPTQLGAGTSHEDAQLLARCPIEHGSDPFAGRGFDDDARNHSFDRIGRGTEADGVIPEDGGGCIGN